MKRTITATVLGAGVLSPLHRIGAATGRQTELAAVARCGVCA